MAGLYLHIPFCKQACNYCDFYFSTDLRYRTELIHAMVTELSIQKDYLAGATVNTIYLGGGTPSLLQVSEIEPLLKAIFSQFNIDSEVEITLEANPDDLSEKKLRELKAVGVNRLSIGIQSFDDTLLKYLNRAHEASAARKCLEDAHASGFHNFSLDLIYAIPGLSEELWRETIEEAVQFSPQHISAYALTIEEKTVFGDWRKKGKLKMVGDETEALQFEILMDVLGENGYDHYEISNFAKPGFISRHNSAYWKRVPYLGIGPSAHSYDGLSRQFNVRNSATYIRFLNGGSLSFEREMLTRENKINEYILTTLRTSWGCDLALLLKEFKDDLKIRCAPYLQQIMDNDLVSLKGDILTLTRNGKLLADKIAEDLMVG